MGWIGWTWDRVRHEDVNVLLLALEGRAELLKAIFGDSAKPRSAPMTSDSFRAFRDRHNQRYAARARSGRRAAGGG